MKDSIKEKEVVTFGEIMLRLSSPGFSRFVQTQNFDVTFGGGEANVAVSLANYGIKTYLVTKLPVHEIGQAALNHLNRFGVNTDLILRGGERIGIYFLETGASQRASKVIYDRAYSALTSVTRNEFDWEKTFEGKSWFHWTGITPALGKNLQTSLLDACKTAKKLGLMISADLNYRAKLWSEKEAQAVMIPLMEFVDLCIANEEDAAKSLGIKTDLSNVEKGKIVQEEYFELSKKMKKEFGFNSVAITFRESFSASRNGWSGLLLDEKDCSTPYISKSYDINIIDRVGGGDAFAAGLIYGLLTKTNTKDALEFAVAASCLKQTIPGDFNHVSIDEIEKLVEGAGSGRVER